MPHELVSTDLNSTAGQSDPSVTTVSIVSIEETGFPTISIIVYLTGYSCPITGIPSTSTHSELTIESKISRDDGMLSSAASMKFTGSPGTGMLNLNIVISFLEFINSILFDSF